MLVQVCHYMNDNIYLRLSVYVLAIGIFIYKLLCVSLLINLYSFIYQLNIENRKVMLKENASVRGKILDFHSK